MAESAESYSALVCDHFAAPRNSACHRPASDVVFGEGGAESEGVRYRLSARVRDRVLTEVRFEAYGCPHVIAAASRLTEQLAGRSIEAASQWTWQSMCRELAIPAEKRGRLLILEDALRSLIAAARTRCP